MTTQAKLRARWQDATGAALARSVLQWLRGDKRPASLERTDSRWDLRGIVFPDPFPFDRGEVEISRGRDLFLAEKTKWRSLDLSHALLPSLRLVDVEVADCVFDRAVAQDLRMWGTHVLDSSFVRADMRDSALATGESVNECDWQGVDFVATDLRRSSFKGGALTNCVFRDARLDGVQFEQTELRHVKFSGVVKAVRFDQREFLEDLPSHVMVGVDFGDAVLENVEFRGCRFEDCAWPPHIELFPRYPEVAKIGSTLLGEGDSASVRLARSILDRDTRLPWHPDSVGVRNRVDDVVNGGAEFDELMHSSLTRAMRMLGTHP